MRALVTGANGFVGLHLVDHLTSCGDEVIESDTNILGSPSHHRDDHLSET